ncbi:MAG: hypothetical protein U9M89_02875 [Patescibacteria group bacterium]|nr:hypothetical protein [Patescibacteria group bacterium]
MATFGDVSTGLGAVRQAANSNKNVAGLMAALMGMGQVGNLLSQYGQYQKGQRQEKRDVKQHKMSVKRFDAAMEEMEYQIGRRKIQEDFESGRLESQGISLEDANNQLDAKRAFGNLVNEHGLDNVLKNPDKYIKGIKIKPGAMSFLTNMITSQSGRQQVGTGKFGTPAKTTENLTEPRNRVNMLKQNGALTKTDIEAETINALSAHIIPAFGAGGDTRRVLEEEGFDKAVKSVRALIDTKNLGPDIRRAVKSHAFATFLDIAQNVPGKNRREGDDSLLAGEHDEWGPETIGRIKKEIEKRWRAGDSMAPLALTIWDDAGKLDVDALKTWQQKDLSFTLDFFSKRQKAGESPQKIFDAYGEINKWFGQKADPLKNPNVSLKGGQYFFTPPGVALGGTLQRPQDIGTDKGFVRQGTLEYNPTTPIGMAKGAVTPATEYLKISLSPLGEDFNPVMLAAERLLESEFRRRLALNPKKTKEQMIKEFKKEGTEEGDLFAEFVLDRRKTKSIAPYGTKTEGRTGFYTTDAPDETVALTRKNAKLKPGQAYRIRSQQYKTQTAGKVLALAEYLKKQMAVRAKLAGAQR